MSRPSLIERLNQGTTGKLTPVSAPAGFGKTTLLAAWLAAPRTNERLVAWLSLDQNDNHPASFWTYLVAALQTVAPGVGVTSHAFCGTSDRAPILPASSNSSSCSIAPLDV